MTAPALVGFIVHRLKLPENTSDWCSSKKRRGRQDSQRSSNQSYHLDSAEPHGRTGFFFVSTTAEESLLVITHALFKQVCDASRFRQPVKITKYSILQVHLSSPPGPLHERITVLELHNDGLEIQANDKMDISDGVHGNALSLTQFRALETLLRKNSGSSEKMSSKETFDITATVDAISPVIAAVPSDPFALIELYEPGDIPQSCVVALKGPAALACHAGIQPGDVITFRQVRRQKWHVPDCFRNKGPSRLVSRVPSHLFVVTDAASVCWEPCVTAPQLPSTAVPLISIQGLIISVETLPSGPNESTVMHCFRLKRDYDDDSFVSHRATDTLYVTHYPMAPELLVGACPGAILRAVNVHKLNFSNPSMDGGQSNFGACLRSSITLLCAASERTDGNARKRLSPTHTSSGNANLSNDGFTNVRRETLSGPAIREIKPMLPFAFGEVRQQYYQNEFRKYLEQCAIGRLVESLHTKGRLHSPLPDLDVIEKIVFQHCTEERPTNNKQPLQKNGMHAKDKHRRKRDPYAEFFDHACDEECSPGYITVPEGFSGCRLSHRDGTCLFPTFVELGEIRNACISNLKSRLAFALSTPLNSDTRESGMGMGIQGGWTGTFCLGGVMLRKAVAECSPSLQRIGCMREYQDDGLPFVACCVVSKLDQESRPSSLADSKFQLPASFVTLSTGRGDSLKQRCQETSLGATVLVDVQSAIVSCMCLGSCATSVSKGTANHVDLPLWQHDQSLEDRKGSSLLLECEGMLFIASVQVRCGRMSVLSQCSPPINMDACEKESSDSSSLVQTMKAKRFTIHECLRGDRASLGHVSHSFVGLLVRQRFRFIKIRNGSFLGCVLTLSHISETNFEDHGCLSASSLSSLQSIELKVSIPLSQDQLRSLQKMMRRLFGDRVGGVLQEQSDLAAAWWQMSDSGQTSSLVANGFDDLVAAKRQGNDPCGDSGGRRVHTQGVPLVVVPCSAAGSGNHGYLRFQCPLAKIKSYFMEVLDDRGHLNLVTSMESELAFDAIGGFKFLPGTLDRRPRRKCLLGQDERIGRSVGELMHGSDDDESGIQMSSLADLHWNMCMDMRNHTQTELGPSIVRVIRNAKLLSISFCRAQAECTNCFQSLIETKSNKNNRPVLGVVSSIQARKQETYWHVPLPMTGDTPSLEEANFPKIMVGSHVPKTTLVCTKTTLVCPNGCPMEHSRIKWECSGVLDDGSGQAKLYAERDAALSLLGAGLHVHDIEAAAWRIHGGILFQKAVPPKSFVRQAVVEAQSLAQQELGTHKRKRRLEEEDVVKFLTSEARAEYYMQHHCRQSPEPVRPLDYYVRCKPLSDEAFSLNQTQVEMTTPPMRDYLQASSMDVTTYSLPPLKLTLVDCSVPQQAENNGSWDLIRALRKTC